jgi:hypothetical protein
MDHRVIGDGPRMKASDATHRVVTTAPLTFQQEWALNHWMHEENLYMVCPVMSIRGSVDVDALHQSLHAVVHMHDALRTRIVEIDGTRQQQTSATCDCELQRVDLTATPTIHRVEEASEIIGAIARERIDLALGPLFRFTLLKLSDSEHALAFAIHHLIFDGISQRVFLEELLRLYGGLIRARVCPPADAPMQYPVYATRQRHEDASWLKEHGPYWSSRLRGSRRVQLPYDEGLQAAEPFRGAYLETSFGSTLTSALHALARREQVSVATVMLVLYAIVLSSWSGHADLVIPFVVPGRRSAAEMRMVGLLGEYLPIRLQLAADEPLAALFRRISRELASAYAHLDLGRITNASPELFTGTSFNWFPDYQFMSTPADWLGCTQCPTIDRFPASQPRRIEWFTKLTCDMGCMLGGPRDDMWALLIFRADLFLPATMQRFFADLKRSAQCATQNSSLRVSSLRGELRGR